MNENYENYAEIDFLDLCKEVMKKWKVIIAVALIFAILGGIIGFVFSKVAKPDTTEEIETLMEDMTQEEITAVEDAANIINTYRAKFNTQKEYNDNSIYQNLDPYAINTVTLVYYVDANGQDKGTITPILQKYAISLKSIDLYEKFAKEIGSEISPSYYQELVSTTYSATDNGNTNSDNNNNVGVLNVVVYGESDELLSKLVEFIKEELESQVVDVVEVYGTHTFVLSSETKSVTIDTEMSKQQNDNLQILTDVTNAISSTESNFSGNQLTYLKYLVHEELEEETSIVRFVVVGLLLGAILAVGYYCLKYVFSKSIKTEEELIGITETIIVGTKNDELGLIATKIDYYAKKIKAKEIAIMSDDKDDEFFDSLKQAVSTAELVLINDSFKNSEEYEKLVSVDGAILIEKLKVSKRDDIIKEIGLCEETDTKVLGIILEK